MTKNEQVRNILAFLSIIFGDYMGEDTDIILRALIKISPDYLIEKYERYILSGTPESKYGINPVLRSKLFNKYLKHWDIA
jgi:hypothetical protein